MVVGRVVLSMVFLGFLGVQFAASAQENPRLTPASGVATNGSSVQAPSSSAPDRRQAAVARSSATAGSQPDETRPQNAASRAAARPASSQVGKAGTVRSGDSGARPPSTQAAKNQKARGERRPVVQDARAARQAQQTKPATGAAARIAKAKAPEGSSAAGRAAAATGAVAASTAAASQPPERPSVGQTIGLNRTPDPLSLHSSVAMVTDARSGDVLLRKNAGAVLPIASITKVMTAMVVLDAQQSLDEVLSISKADIDRAKGTSSRLSPGVHLKRRELLQLALMSSENRAANALGRHYPGGLPGFVNAMNMKAKELGMGDTRFVEPTGLSSGNVSTARDLSVMVRYAGNYPLIREMSTASSLTVLAGRQQMSFFNTNRLVSSNQWSIGLQKTGYISEAGNCLVMQTLIDGRPMIVVLLDAAGKLSRFGDAQRIRDWIRKTDPPTQRLTRQSEPVRPLRVSYPLAPASS